MTNPKTFKELPILDELQTYKITCLYYKFKNVNKIGKLPLIFEDRWEFYDLDRDRNISPID